MKSKNIISSEFENILSFKDDSDELYHESRMIMFRVLSEVERLCEAKKMKKKDLAKAIGTSASYITQIFNGDKLINLETIAKFQIFFNVVFIVEAKSNDLRYEDNIPNILQRDEENGFGIFQNTKKILENDATGPDYNSNISGNDSYGYLCSVA